MRLILSIFLAIMITGCASKPVPVATKTSHIGIDGTVDQVILKMNSRDMAEVKRAEAQERCVAAMSSAGALAIPAGATTEQIVVALAFHQMGVAIQALAQNGQNSNPCDMGPNLNEVQIAKAQEVSKRLGIGLNMAKWIVGGYLGSEAIAALAAGTSGIRINGDNNGVRGVNTGDNGSARYTEQTAPFGGVPLNPADVEPITLNPDPVIVDPVVVDPVVVTPSE